MSDENSLSLNILNKAYAIETQYKFPHAVRGLKKFTLFCVLISKHELRLSCV